MIGRKLTPGGVKLAVGARSEVGPNDLVNKLGAAGATAFAIPADITDATQRAALVQTAVENVGGSDARISMFIKCSAIKT